ncbi:MAG: hypothetical protein AAGA27_01890 [Pseudomonadota bacterium]
MFSKFLGIAELNRQLKLTFAIVILAVFVDSVAISVFYATVLSLVIAKHSVFNVIGKQEKQFVLSGLFLSFPLANFVIAPFWGICADRYGRKPILFMVLILSALALFRVESRDSYSFSGIIYC